MLNLFFSPNGQISPADFSKGAVILLAFNFVLWLAWFTNVWLALFAGLMALITIYCWACLFIKRLRWSGKSGFLFIPIFLLFMVLAWLVIPLLVMPIMPVSEESLLEFQKMDEMRENLQDNPPETLGDVLPVYDQMFRVYQGFALRFAIVFFISGAITAFGFNRLIRSKV